MNILILSWRGPGHPHEGGAEQVTHEHAKAWISAGHEVTLFTSSYDGAKDHEVIDGVEIIRKGNQTLGVHIAAVFWYLFGKNNSYDIIIDQFHGIPFFTTVYARTKIVGFIHEVAKDVWLMNPWPKPYNFLPAALGPLVEQNVFKLYKNKDFLTVSESTKKDLIEMGIKGKNITIIHNGVNLDLPKKKFKKEKKKTAVYLGAISKDKGTEDAVKVFSEIENKDTDWQYWVIGRGSEEYMNELRQQTKALGINKKVKFWGFVSDKKKFELLTKAHVLINTSMREGWGLVNIEANAVGMPVAGYDVAGVRDSVIDGKTGILVQKGDYKSLALRVVKLVQNEKVYNKTSHEALKWSKKFDWKESKKQSVEYIENL